MISSRSFRNRQRREEAVAAATPITHTEIMRKRGTNKSIQAPGDIKKYKGGTRVPINLNDSYKVYSYNMPASNGSGEYKITAGTQTLIILDGVLFVNKSNKKDTDRVILRDNDFITFSKGDTVSFCPNAAPMNGIFIESSELKTKKVSDPITNSTGVDVFHNARQAKRANYKAPDGRRREKSQAEREAYGQAYMASRGVVPKHGVPTNATGQRLAQHQQPEFPAQAVNPAEAVVEGTNPQPIGDKGE